MEAKARAGRYEVLDRYPLVLLAHTSNDQIETMLLGFGWGSGMRSIKGMSDFRDRHYGRPFLGLTREDMLAVCTSNGFEVWDDPHNDHIEFRRVHVRKKVVPALVEVFGAGVLKNFERTAVQLQEDSEALELWARTSVPAGTTPDFLPVMQDLPPAVSKRILKNWLEPRTRTTNPLRAVVIERVMTLTRDKTVPVSKGINVTKRTDGWHITTS